MDGIWAPLVTAAAFVLILGGLVWLGARMRRRGIGGSALGPFEEIWDPTTYRTQIEIQIQAERKAPSPGDPLRDQPADP